MPLFIDRMPFHSWVDLTRSPPVPHWIIVLPVMVSEPLLMNAPAAVIVQDWELDTGNRGEGFAWRYHLLQAGLDPNQNRLPHSMTIRTVSGKVVVPVRDIDLWLVSNLTVLPPTPYRIALQRGLPFLDIATVPDPQLHAP